MSYYPAFLKLTHRPCLVVGGGGVAATKVDVLVRAGAAVTVVAPEIEAPLRELAAGGRISHRARAYRGADVRGMRLVIAATDDEALNRRVAGDADREGALVNVVDSPELCTFIVPAVLERGELQIAVSTSGSAPSFAAHVRDRVGDEIGPEYAVALAIVRRLREALRAEARPLAERRRILREIAASDLVTLAKTKDRGRIDRVLAECAGGGVSLERLGVVL